MEFANSVVIVIDVRIAVLGYSYETCSLDGVSEFGDHCVLTDELPHLAIPIEIAIYKCTKYGVHPSGCSHRDDQTVGAAQNADFICRAANRMVPIDKYSRSSCCAQDPRVSSSI